MNLNNIMEIGILNNAKIENVNEKTTEKRDLIIFKFTDNTIKYLDIAAGKELQNNEKVLINHKTKITLLYQNHKIKLENFKKSHTDLDIKLENGILKVNKIDNE